MPPAVEVQSLNHWTSREVLIDWILVAMVSSAQPPSFFSSQILSCPLDRRVWDRWGHMTQPNQSHFFPGLSVQWVWKIVPCMWALLEECGSGFPILWRKKVYQRRAGNNTPAERKRGWRGEEGRERERERERYDHIISTADLLSPNLLSWALEPMNCFLFRWIWVNFCL